MTAENETYSSFVATVVLAHSFVTRLLYAILCSTREGAMEVLRRIFIGV